MYTINDDQTITFEHQTVSFDTLKKALADIEQASKPDMLANLPDIDNVEFVQGANEKRLGVKTPFVQRFVQDLRRQCPTARWSANQKAWFVDVESRDVLVSLVEQYFNSPTQRYRLSFDIKRPVSNITIDGNHLLNVSRDAWSWDNRNTTGITVISESLESGGSRKYPSISGQLTIEIDLRADVLILPTPATIESV